MWGFHVDSAGLVSLHDAHLSTEDVPSEALSQALAEAFPEWGFVEDANGDTETDGDGGGGGGGCFISAVVHSLGPEDTILITQP